MIYEDQSSDHNTSTLLSLQIKDYEILKRHGFSILC